MAKKSSTKVYGFKPTPMREQFKRERELLMRQIRRYERKGYGFESSVKAMVPEKERAGQRITKKYIEDLRTLRAGLADLALKISDDGELVGRVTDDGKFVARTAREDTHYRRGVHAQAKKREKARERQERELRRKLKEGLRNEKPVLDEEGKPVPLEAQYAAADREAGLIEPGDEPTPPSLPSIAEVMVNNYISYFEDFTTNPAAQGARVMVEKLKEMREKYGYRDLAAAIEEHGYDSPTGDVGYSVMLANATLSNLVRSITGDSLEGFEADGGYWPADDLYA